MLRALSLSSCGPDWGAFLLVTGSTMTDGVPCHPPSKDHPQVVHFGSMEEAFFEGEKEVVSLCYGENVMYGGDVILKRCASGDSDVVNVDMNGSS